jgi:Flp pilus assembly protein TadG
MLRRARRLMKGRRGAVIVEFALVVPLLMLIVFGIIDFSRAYAQLNNINSSLREGARFGAAQINPNATDIKAEITRFSTAWANPLNVNLVNVNVGAPGPDIVVSVTDYPIDLPTLGGFLRILNRQILVSRTVSFKWERSCPIGGGPGCP